MKCDFCGAEETLPFICNYCGGAFCGNHRLPEAHQCKGDLTQKRTVVPPPQTTFSWQTPAAPPYAQRQGSVFSRIEIRDIFFSWIALGVAFGFALGGGGVSLLTGGGVSGGDVLELVGVSLVTVGPGFVFHELSHKFVAQRYGYWAEFRMWLMGLALALIMSFLSPFIFAAPGATYISGMNITKSENGKISIAGPLVNVAIAALFLPLLLFEPSSSLLGNVGWLGVYINLFLALFNLLPIGPLDGSKVFRWSLPIWLATIAPVAVAWYVVLIHNV